MRTHQQILAEATINYERRDFERALQLYDKVLSDDPDNAYVIHCVGTCLIDMGYHGAAIAMLERAVSINGEFEDMWHNLGVCYRKEEHVEKAIGAYQRALALKSDSPTILANIAGCYVNYGEPNLCIQYADQALKIDPDNVMAKQHKAFALLEKGKYREGWELYESRLNAPKFHKRKYPGVKWDGTDVGSLVIHGEQGIGDEILFMSCFQNVVPLARHIVIECEPRLKRIFERSFSVPCYGSEKELLQFEAPEAWIPMGSLPYLFRQKRSDFPQVPYLKPDMQLVQAYKQLRKHPHKPLVGISWLGGTKATHTSYRSIPLEKWGDILSQDAEYVSLQYNDLDEKLPSHVKRWPHNNEMDELCAMASACDLVITVDQTLVHQCGAMGQEAWVMISDKPSWRYNVGNNPGMDWYDSIDLYRGHVEKWQKQVIEAVTKDLEAYCADFGKIQSIKPKTA